MRKLVLIDIPIPKDEALALLDDYGEWYEKQTGITPDFYVERRDFSVVPTVADSVGALKPTYEYRQGIADEVHSRYGDYGVDDIVMWVAEENFLYRGVWGTAWSYVHRKYNFLLCRWDKDNSTNTWNTFFHEGEHPANTLIKEELGIDINPLIANHFNEPGFDYDRDYVHGNSPQFKYIGGRGYQRDGRMLKFLAPYLRQAYDRRKEKHMKPVKTVMLQVISILQKYLLLHRN